MSRPNVLRRCFEWSHLRLVALMSRLSRLDTITPLSRSRDCNVSVSSRSHWQPCVEVTTLCCGRWRPASSEAVVGALFKLQPSVTIHVFQSTRHSLRAGTTASITGTDWRLLTTTRHSLRADTTASITGTDWRLLTTTRHSLRADTIASTAGTDWRLLTTTIHTDTSLPRTTSPSNNWLLWTVKCYKQNMPVQCH